MRKPLVAVIGCGPSGLLAAHACWLHDVPYVILSKRQKSRLGGAQFSHIPIQGIHDEYEEEPVLTYRVEGNEQTYQNKVYGTEPVPFVSFGNVKDGMTVPAWSLTEMYDVLWTKYNEQIVDYEVTPTWLEQLAFGYTFDLVLCSAPARAMCLGSIDPSRAHHVFRTQTVQIMNECLDQNFPDMTIMYDGTKEHSWYRQSRIFGVGSTEWGAHVAIPPVGEVRQVAKPISTNCDCHMNGAVVRVGRYGTWRKGDLTFHAFNTAIDILSRWGLT